MQPYHIPATKNKRNYLHLPSFICISVDVGVMVDIEGHPCWRWNLQRLTYTPCRLYLRHRRATLASTVESPEGRRRTVRMDPKLVHRWFFISSLGNPQEPDLLLFLFLCFCVFVRNLYFSLLSVEKKCFLSLSWFLFMFRFLLLILCLFLFWGGEMLTGWRVVANWLLFWSVARNFSGM